MIVIPPIVLTDAMIVSSDIAEPDTGETVWNSATDYSIGQQAIRTQTHKIYENILGGIDSTPPEDSAISLTPRWVEVGPTNKYAMFDLLRSSTTKRQASITTEIAPGIAVNSIALTGVVNAHNVQITVRDGPGGSIIFTSTDELGNKKNSYSWYTYFYNLFNTEDSAVKYTLPTTTNNPYITVTVNGPPAEFVEVGAVVIGNYQEIGKVQNGATVQVLNFSIIDRDEFGEAILVPRRNVPKTSQNIFIDKSKLNDLIKLKKSLDGKPALWSGMRDDVSDNYFNALVVLGFYRTFTFDIDNPIGAMVNLELEEL